MKKRFVEAEFRAALAARFGEQRAAGAAVAVQEDGGVLVTPAAPIERRGHEGAVFPIENLQVVTLARADGTPEELIGVSFSSEYPVTRWGEAEILSHDPEDCDFSRLEQIGAVLKNHDPDQVVGVPVVVKLDPKTRRGTSQFRFGTTPEALKARHEVVVDKTVRGISVGYTVAAWVYLSDEDVSYKGRIKGPAWVAAKWQAIEYSLTPIAADPSVGIGRTAARSKSEATTQEPVERRNNIEEETRMTPEELKRKQADEEAQRAAASRGGAPAAGAPPARAEAPAEVVDVTAVIQAERTRVKDIGERCRRFGLPDTFRDELVESGATVEDACRRINDRLAERGAAGAGAVAVVRDGRSSFLEAAVEGLLLRGGLIPRTDAKHGAQLANLTLLEMARECLRQAGVSDKGDRREVAARALRSGVRVGRSEVELFLERKETITGATSDFPILLAAGAYKALMGAYTVTPVHYRLWCAVGSVSDFKAATRVELSDTGELPQIAELGPYTGAKFADKGETNQVFTYGRIFTMSRQGIINDDLGGFLRIPQAFGRRARKLPQNLALKKLLANGVMSDTVALFAGGHANISTSGSYALDTLAHAEAGIIHSIGVLQAQRAFVHADDAADAEYLALAPRVLLCNATDKFVARQACRSSGALADEKNAGVINPIAEENIQVIGEPNLANGTWSGSAKRWYLFADPAEAPVIEVVFLNGDDTPFMEEEDQTNVDGRSWKVRLDVGCNAIGFRGAVYEKGEA